MPHGPVQESTGGQGVHREVGSEGLEENHRVVIKGAIQRMNRSAKDGQWSSQHYDGEGAWVPVHRTKVCAGDTVGKKRL